MFNAPEGGQPMSYSQRSRGVQGILSFSPGDGHEYNFGDFCVEERGEGDEVSVWWSL